MGIVFPVSPAKNNSLQDRMERLEILEKDLAEQFVKSSGKGGQNVNKVSTAVVLTHLPTEIQIKCSEYRTQGLNRYKARVLLCDRVEERQKPELLRERVRLFRKKKKQKQKRSALKYQELKRENWESEMET